MNKYFFPILIKIWFLLLFVSFLTFFFPLITGGGCGSDYSYLNPFGFKMSPTKIRICPAVITKVSHPIHFILTDISFLWSLFLGVYLSCKREKTIIKKILRIIIMVWCLAVVFLGLSLLNYN